MTPVFWKVSMGPGGISREFKDLLSVLDWIRRGVVLVNKNVGSLGGGTSQFSPFIDKDRTGDYFYLCHGNQEPSVILLGQFSGPANLHCSWSGWAERPFNWIKTSVSTKQFQGSRHWWTPNQPTTFAVVPENELNEFEEGILRPYFEFGLNDFS